MPVEPIDTFDELKNWQWINLQSGVPLEGDKFNIESQIAWHHIRRAICELIGNGSSNDGFKINDTVPTDPTIMAGNIYVCGLKIELESATTYLTQPYSGEAPAIVPGNGCYYLDVTIEKIGVGDDPEIVDPAIGIECIKPYRIKWVVKRVNASAALPAPHGTDDIHIMLFTEILGIEIDVRNTGDVDAGSTTGYEDREGGYLGWGHDHIDTDIINIQTVTYVNEDLAFVLDDMDDRLIVLELSGAPPAFHAASHEDGGGDPIDLTAFADHQFRGLNSDVTDTTTLWANDPADIINLGTTRVHGWNVELVVSGSTYLITENVFNIHKVYHYEGPGSDYLEYQTAHQLMLRLRRSGTGYTVGTWGFVTRAMGELQEYYDLTPGGIYDDEPYLGWNYATGAFTVDDTAWGKSLRQYGISFDARSPERLAVKGTNILLEGYFLPQGDPGAVVPTDPGLSHIHCWKSPMHITTNNLYPGTVDTGYDPASVGWTRDVSWAQAFNMWLDLVPLTYLIAGVSPSTARTEMIGSPNDLLRDYGDMDESGRIGVFEWNLMNQKVEGTIEYADSETWASNFGNPDHFATDDNSFFINHATPGMRDLDLDGDLTVDNTDRVIMRNVMDAGHDGIRGYANVVMPTYWSSVSGTNLEYAEDATDPKPRTDHVQNMAHYKIFVTITAAMVSAGFPTVVQFDPDLLMNRNISGFLGATARVERASSIIGSQPVRLVNSFEVEILDTYTSAITSFNIGVTGGLLEDDMIILELVGLKEQFIYGDYV